MTQCSDLKCAPWLTQYFYGAFMFQWSLVRQSKRRKWLIASRDTRYKPVFLFPKHKIELYLHRAAAKHPYPRLSLFVLLHIQHIRALAITQEPNSPRCLHIDHLGGVGRRRTNTQFFFFFPPHFAQLIGWTNTQACMSKQSRGLWEVGENWHRGCDQRLWRGGGN